VRHCLCLLGCQTVNIFPYCLFVVASACDAGGAHVVGQWQHFYELRLSQTVVADAMSDREAGRFDAVGRVSKEPGRHGGAMGQLCSTSELYTTAAVWVYVL
jgi:hypothetical protein